LPDHSHLQRHADHTTTLDADPNSTHKGETREQRLAEFHEENSLPVAGLREGSWLKVTGSSCELAGETGMKLFRHGANRITSLTRWF